MVIHHKRLKLGRLLLFNLYCRETIIRGICKKYARFLLRRSHLHVTLCMFTLPMCSFYLGWLKCFLVDWFLHLWYHDMVSLVTENVYKETFIDKFLKNSCAQLCKCSKYNCMSMDCNSTDKNLLRWNTIIIVGYMHVFLILTITFYIANLPTALLWHNHDTART